MLLARKEGSSAGTIGAKKGGEKKEGGGVENIPSQSPLLNRGDLSRLPRRSVRHINPRRTWGGYRPQFDGACSPPPPPPVGPRGSGDSWPFRAVTGSRQDGTRRGQAHRGAEPGRVLARPALVVAGGHLLHCTALISPASGRVQRRTALFQVRWHEPHRQRVSTSRRWTLWKKSSVRFAVLPMLMVCK